MITYRIINTDGTPLKLIRNRQPLTLAEIARMLRRQRKARV